MEPQLDEILQDIVQRLRSVFSPVYIYQYGSCARGEMRPGSDIDLLVVVEDSSLTFFQRGALAYRALRPIPVPIDVQVYTRSEFELRAALPVSFERTVRTQGKILHAA